MLCGECGTVSYIKSSELKQMQNIAKHDSKILFDFCGCFLVVKDEMMKTVCFCRVGEGWWDRVQIVLEGTRRYVSEGMVVAFIMMVTVI
jgi:hypothetical protein